VALLVPSIWHEVFGIVTLEAFAARTPVIAHARGALPEIIAESGGGLIYRTQIELLAALTRCHNDPALRARLGDAGHAAYRRLWSEDPHLCTYFGLIEQAIARKRAPVDPRQPGTP
jgi:glycosyltransferase involved in cell wall biosynthesis